MTAIARHHSEWLSLVETSGPFLSLPVLADVFPQGLEAHDAAHIALMRQAAREWSEQSPPDPAIHREWIRFVLGRTLGFPDELIAEGQTMPPQLAVPVLEYGETLRPDLAILTPPGRTEAGTPRLLVQILPSGQAIDKALPGRRWTASPATRMVDLLHGSGVRLGLVTNGEQWLLVNAPARETSGFTSWFTPLWLEEPLTLQAFRTLLSVSRFFGVSDQETPEALLDRSAADQQEVTDQLGRQVRDAVEILIQALDRIDKDSGRALLRDVDETRLYESALTVMMRLVFLLAAEERDLLPGKETDREIYDASYAASTLRAQLRAAADRAGEEILERRHDAWSRLVAAFRAVYGGVRHERLELAAYGGGLFDPDRFPFLEGRPTGSSWRETQALPLPINNRTVLHLLEALQQLQIRVSGGTEARLLSFRSLDIEQIGHVYEGLLDHTARRTTEPMLGLAGSKDREPELALAALEAKAAQGSAPLIAYLKEETGRSENALRKLLPADPAAAVAPSLPGDRSPRPQPPTGHSPHLLTACDNDEALFRRVLPFAPLLRLDSNGYPVVITIGSVYVTKGSDRRSTGTHYTPRSLTEPIVRYTLEPLVYHGPAEGLAKQEWQLRPAADLLGLKICDMAMGSGAFLVQTCRYLAERLVESWQEAEAAQPGRVVISPEGTLSTGDPSERPIPREAEERLTLARRLVADRCLYGVDKNPMAVEMAKVSLWLITLQKDRPFTFLDHALRWGDSLLGVDVAQLKTWNMRREGAATPTFWHRTVEMALERALKLRRQIAQLEDLDVRVIEQKAELLRKADQAMALVKLGGDLLVGSALAGEAEQQGVMIDRLTRYTIALTQAEEHERHSYTPEGLRQSLIPAQQLRTEAARLLGVANWPDRIPFHWPLEFPEVFLDLAAPDEVRGFDAVIGNPPFQGGKLITGPLGTDYRNYMVDNLAKRKRGSADLCAYFFLRVYGLLREGGDLSLLATNTIAQGDTREVGLDQLVADGATIMRAEPSRKWPGEASLEIAELWLRRGSWRGDYVLDDKLVPRITSFLTPPGIVDGVPHRLQANTGKAFQGSVVLGMGFVLEPEVAAALIAQDQRNGDVLFPYLSGEDLNSRANQSPSRWVINFHDWSLERAENYKDCMVIVRERVKPERDKNNKRVYQQRWWQFAERCPGLYTAIAGIERVLVSCRVTKFLSHSMVQSGSVFDVGLNVFPSTDRYFVCLLQSTLYDEWIREYASTLETRIRYTLVDCFETFPFSVNTTDLDNIGEQYYAHRQLVMLVRQEGLTKTYNRFHRPDEHAADIATLRRLHVEMDQAVAAAYGWTDLDLGHGFHQTKQGMRYTISEAARREVLGRLLALNHARYAEEVRQGLHDKGAKGKGGAKGRQGTRGAVGQAALFGE